MNKQRIPSPEDYIKKYGWTHSAITEYAKEVVKYTLEQAAGKGLVTITGVKGGQSKSEISLMGKVKVKIDKQSILSLESEIIKDLQL